MLVIATGSRPQWDRHEPPSPRDDWIVLVTAAVPDPVHAGHCDRSARGSRDPPPATFGATKLDERSSWIWGASGDGVVDRRRAVRRCVRAGTASRSQVGSDGASATSTVRAVVADDRDP